MISIFPLIAFSQAFALKSSIRFVIAASRRTTEAPLRRSSQRGRISKRFKRLRIDDSTAPFAAEVQSLLAKTLRSESHVDAAFKRPYSRKLPDPITV
jgi:hypothetical protein